MSKGIPAEIPKLLDHIIQEVAAIRNTLWGEEKAVSKVEQTAVFNLNLREFPDEELFKVLTGRGYTFKKGKKGCCISHKTVKAK